jgi:hypothetical protein
VCNRDTGNELIDKQLNASEGLWMPKRVLSTIAIGDDYFRMGIALMRSAHSFTPSIDHYIIYTDDQTDTELFSLPDYIELQPCIRNRDRFPGNPYAPRMDKSAPIIDPKFRDSTVVFLDSDTIVCRDVLEHVFDEVERYSVLIHGTQRDDEFDWMTRPKPNGENAQIEGFNLRKAARSIGIDIPNFTLNAGIFGRAPDAAGLWFSDRADELLKTPPFEIWSNSQYLNDEPFLAISYLEAKEKFKLVHKAITREIYMGLANKSHDVVMEEHGSIRIGTDRPAIVHFAGKHRRDTEIYRYYLRRFAPVKPDRIADIGHLVEKNEIFADLRSVY